jgi:hypothetical protein
MLLSLPFLWGGQLTGMFQMPLSIPLLKAAWRISADGEIGLKALVAIQTHGQAAEAIGCALAWIEKTPRVELTAYAGLLAANAGLGDIARNMLIMSQQLGKDKQGLTECLEYLIALRFDDSPTATVDCARGLESRSDLSPTVSKMVHTELLWTDLLGGKLDQAQRRAERMTAVADEPIASVALAAIARHDGNDFSAERHISKTAKLPAAERHYYHFLAACGTGADDEAREHLAKLNDLNAALAETAVRNVNAMRGAQ